MSHLPAKIAGFTLLELMITSLLGALLLMGGTAMFGLFMRNSSATAIRNQINQEGQQVQAFMEYHLRNAQVVNCSGGVISMTTQSGATMQFESVGSGLTAFISMSPDAGTTDYRLHSQFPAAVSSFQCATSGALSPNATNAQIVNINFTLTSPSGVDQQFQTTVQVRNANLR